MRTLEKRLRMILFKTLSFNRYLTIVSRTYFLLYQLGLFKNNPTFKYHYFLKSIINRNDIIIDIGANLGYFSIPFSKWAGPDGMVYAVEPISQLSEILQKNIGNRRNIKIVPYALGNENKQITMGNNTRQSTGAIKPGSNYVLEENIIAVDEFKADMKKGSELFSDLEKLDFIKCDVEGYENVIIPEMNSILTEHKPLMLIETRREKRIFLLDYLLKIGFHGYVLEDKKLFPASEIEEKTEDDILFIHKAKLESFSDLIASANDAITQ